MPYATVTDLQQRYGAAELLQLSDITSPRTGAMVPAVLERALGDASAWIDSYLVGRYAVPITDSAALVGLRLHCCAEARYLLMTVSADDAVMQGHKERAAFFASVARGDIALIAPTAVPPETGAGSVVFEAGSKVFGRDESDCGDRRARGGW